MTVNFDIFAFNSKFICNIALSLQNVLNLNSTDPCPVILLPETSPGVIRQVDYMLQTGSCIIWREEEGLKILEVADMLGLPISGRGRSPEGSEEKTSLPKATLARSSLCCPISNSLCSFQTAPGG